MKIQLIPTQAITHYITKNAQGDNNPWITLVDLRNALADYSREEIDQALTDLAVAKVIRLGRKGEHTWDNTEADRAAELTLAGKRLGMVAMNR